jgi:hypothetical protein
MQQSAQSVLWTQWQKLWITCGQPVRIAVNDVKEITVPEAHWMRHRAKEKSRPDRPCKKSGGLK